MTIHEIINPLAVDLLFMAIDNNPLACESPDHNPRGWGEPQNNPKGQIPVLNPEHYINPLSGRYTSGPLDF